MEDIKKVLRETAKSELPDPIITLAYVEHQMDLMAQLIVDMAESQTLSAEATERLNMLKQLLEHSSVDFANLADPLQAYKIPKAIEYKENTRDVSIRYLMAQIRERVF